MTPLPSGPIPNPSFLCHVTNDTINRFKDHQKNRNRFDHSSDKKKKKFRILNTNKQSNNRREFRYSLEARYDFWLDIINIAICKRGGDRNETGLKNSYIAFLFFFSLSSRQDRGCIWRVFTTAVRRIQTAATHDADGLDKLPCKFSPLHLRPSSIRRWPARSRLLWRGVRKRRTYTRQKYHRPLVSFARAHTHTHCAWNVSEQVTD